MINVYFFLFHFQDTFILFSLYPLTPLPALLRGRIASLPCCCICQFFFLFSLIPLFMIVFLFLGSLKFFSPKKNSVAIIVPSGVNMHFQTLGYCKPFVLIDYKPCLLCRICLTCYLVLVLFVLLCYSISGWFLQHLSEMFYYIGVVLSFLAAQVGITEHLRAEYIKAGDLGKIPNI